MCNSISTFYILYSLRYQTAVSGFISYQEMDLDCKDMISSDNIQIIILLIISHS